MRAGERNKPRFLEGSERGKEEQERKERFLAADNLKKKGNESRWLIITHTKVQKEKSLKSAKRTH